MTAANVSKVFHMIEMPLLVSVSEAEYSGIPIDVSFFSELRQNLNDRMKLIEYYFNKFAGKVVSLGSPSEILRLKENLHQKRNAKTKENLPFCACDGSSLFLIIDRLVSEWRTHSLLGPLCTSILSSKTKRRDDSLHRVMSTFHTVGAETGRLTVSSPPLQRVPHECQLRKCLRPTLYEEMNSAQSRSKEDLMNFVRSINFTVNSSKVVEWVRVSSLKKTESSYSYPSSSSHGQIHMITTVPISKPAIHGKYNSSLAELWRTNGFEYSTADSDQINQIVVTFNTKGDQCSIDQKSRGAPLYCYPADQVTRLLAAITPNQTERQELFDRVHAYTAGLPDPGALSHAALDVINPRSGFTANKGYFLLAADYCQIELRLMAHFSGDKKLLSAFNDATAADIFKLIAARWQKLPVSEVTDADRQKVKHLCYAVIYGAGPNLISEQQVSHSNFLILLTSF